LVDAARTMTARGADGAVDAGVRAKTNRRLVDFERAFLDEAGIPERPWYKHQLYAPKFTYAAEILPALTEAAEAKDAVRVAAAQAQLARALARATAVLTSDPAVSGSERR
jgi:N-acetylated-alpha-linked acidic dipeptidase